MLLLLKEANRRLADTRLTTRRIECLTSRRLCAVLKKSGSNTWKNYLWRLKMSLLSLSFLLSFPERTGTTGHWNPLLYETSVKNFVWQLFALRLELKDQTVRMKKKLLFSLFSLSALLFCWNRNLPWLELRLQYMHFVVGALVQIVWSFLLLWTLGAKGKKRWKLNSFLPSFTTLEFEGKN